VVCRLGGLLKVIDLGLQILEVLLLTLAECALRRTVLGFALLMEMLVTIVS
jgi:hypothetical protein